MPKTAKAQNLHPKTLPFQIVQHSTHAKNSERSKPTSQNVALPNLPTFETCRKQQKLKTYIPKRCLSKSSNMRNMPKTAKAQNLHPKTLPFQIFQNSRHAESSKTSKPTSPNVAFPNLPTFEACQKQQRLKTYIPKRCLSKSSNMRNMPKTAKAQNLHPKTLPFQIVQRSNMPKTAKSSKPTSLSIASSNLPTFETCQKQQKLKTYIPKRCLSKSSNIRHMPKIAKAQNLHPKTLPCQIFQHSKHAENSKSSKPASQNVGFPNLLTFEACQKTQKLKTYIPKRCLSKSSHIRNMPKTAKSSKLTSQNVAFPNPPSFETCQKQPKAQNLHPKTLRFQIFQHSKHAKNSKTSKPTSQNVAFPNLPTFETCQKQQKLKTYIPKRCLAKSSNILNMPKQAKSSKPTSQQVAFPNLPTCETCQKQQKLKTHIPKRCLSKSSNIRNMPQTAKAQNLHAKTLHFQIFQHSKHAKNSKSSKPTSQNVGFPNLPTFEACQKQQRLKTYIPKHCLSKSSSIRNMPKTAKARNLHPKTLPFQTFQHSTHAKNSQKLKTYIPKCCLSKSFNIRNMPKNKSSEPTSQNVAKHAKNSKSSKPTSQNVAFKNLPAFETCQKQQKLKTYIPKRCLSKPSNIRNMPKTAKAQNLHPKTLPFRIFQHSKHAKNSKGSKPTSQNVALPNLPTFDTCQKQKLRTYIPKHCLSKSSNSRNMPKTAKSSKPTSQNVAFPNLPTFETCQKQQKLKIYIPKRCLSKSSNMRNMPKTAKAQNLHPKTLPFQTFQHLKYDRYMSCKKSPS